MAEVDVVVYYQRQVVFQLLVDQSQKSLAKSRVAREAGSSGFPVAIRCGCDAFLKKRLGKTNPLRHLLQVPVKKFNFRVGKVYTLLQEKGRTLDQRCSYLVKSCLNR